MDEDLKLADKLLFEATAGYMTSVTRDVMAEAAAAITRLHAEIEALKSDVDELVRAGSDEATENERLREALRPFAVWAQKMPDVVPEFPSDISKVVQIAIANGHLTGEHFRAASRALGREG